MSRGQQGEADLQPDSVLRIQGENHDYNNKVHNNHAADNNNEENHNYTPNYDNYKENNETNNNDIVTEADIRGSDQGPE